MTTVNLDHPPIFIGGAGRSGTTLLRVMLDSHPNIACGPELKVIPAWLAQWEKERRDFGPYAVEHLGLGNEVLDDSYRSKILALLEQVRTHSGKPRVAEKTPNSVLFFGHLNRLFPESPLIHIIRDGRDVVASLLETEWFDPKGNPIPYTQDAAKAARYWVEIVSAGLNARDHLRDRVLELRYEALVSDPESVMRDVLDHVGESWDESVLRHFEHDHDLGGESSAKEVARPVHRKSIGRWRHTLNERDLSTVSSIAGQLLERLGYS